MLVNKNSQKFNFRCHDDILDVSIVFRSSDGLKFDNSSFWYFEAEI